MTDRGRATEGDPLPATDGDSPSGGRRHPRARPAGPRERLVAAGLVPGSWSNGPGDVYSVHRHEYDKVLVVERGSIAFGLPERGEVVTLAYGDRLDLPAGTDHDARVGPDGVTCLEAHCPRGTLQPQPQVCREGEWD